MTEKPTIFEYIKPTLPIPEELFGDMPTLYDDVCPMDDKLLVMRVGLQSQMVQLQRQFANDPAYKDDSMGLDCCVRAAIVGMYMLIQPIAQTYLHTKRKDMPLRHRIMRRALWRWSRSVMPQTLLDSPQSLNDLLGDSLASDPACLAFLKNAQKIIETCEEVVGQEYERMKLQIAAALVNSQALQEMQHDGLLMQPEEMVH